MQDAQIATLRTQLAALVAGGQAYARPQLILAGVPAGMRGVRPEGFGRSLWELLEHLRIDQREMLDVGVVEVYRMLEPDELWPTSPAPPDDAAWASSVTGFLADLEETRRLLADESIDPFDVVPHHATLTWLRKVLLIVDHNTYHLGQFVAVRRLLGIWPPEEDPS